MLKNQSKMNLTVVKADDDWEDVRDFEDEEKGVDPKEKRAKKLYMKEFHKILEMADIIIEVLDARDPISSRCKEAEKILSTSKHEKKLVIVLNKIDLVPLPIVMAWKKELGKEYPVILFKANTQRQGINYGENKLYQNSLNKNPELVADMLKSTKSLGTHKLFELIKNYSREGKEKKAVTVGVIGYPNVGKSSIINSLKRKRAAGVSSKAGYTTSLQEVEIDSKVKIIDSPGVILSTDSEAVLVLRNQANAAEVKDPITPIGAILDRVSRNHMMNVYKIGSYEDATSFLYNIAVAKGKFKKVN
jgi:nuclear GTP-binding protein